MKKITLISIILATFAAQSFAYCPIPQWCPKADLHQTLCPGDTIDPIEFPSVMGKTLIINWWTDGTRFASINTPNGITVSGPPENREHSAPVSIKGAPTAVGTHHYTVSNTCGVELLHGSITAILSIPNTPGTITFSPTSVCPGDTFTASIAAVSSATSYNWTTPAGMTDDGSNGTTLSITDTTSGSFAISVIASNACGTSAPSTQNITIALPAITAHPALASPTVGRNAGFATLSVTATGTAPLAYRWYSNTINSNVGGTLISGATSASYTPSSAVFGSMLHYYCVVTNACGIDTSNVSGLHTVNSSCDLFADLDFAGSNLGTPYFKTNRTWTITGTVDGQAITQTWSDVVLAPGCDKGMLTHRETVPFTSGCVRNSTSGGSGTRPATTQTSAGYSNYYGDLFTWCAVIRFADQLCPGDWRVPTTEEFRALSLALG
ncbi:MAG: fibrobacter succinogenes major paralogous domain-containing protein, partial [Bacteroidales bacterium]|nr:fibrobacter succinogenes major paralogous domain-containing protein [Bacteroidales bacterium]